MGGQGELRLWAWRWRPDPVPVPVPCREQPGGSCARPHPHRERTRALSTPRLSALPRSLAPTMPGSHGGRRAASTCLSCPPDPGSPLPPASFYLWLPHGTPVHTPTHTSVHMRLRPSPAPLHPIQRLFLTSPGSPVLGPSPLWVGADWTDLLAISNRECTPPGAGYMPPAAPSPGAHSPGAHSRAWAPSRGARAAGSLPLSALVKLSCPSARGRSISAPSARPRVRAVRRSVRHVTPPVIRAAETALPGRPFPCRWPGTALCSSSDAAMTCRPGAHSQVPPEPGAVGSSTDPGRPAQAPLCSPGTRPQQHPQAGVPGRSPPSRAG